LRFDVFFLLLHSLAVDQITSFLSFLPTMERYGNTSTYNVENVLSKNITGSEYWRKTASKLATVEVREE